VSRRPNLFTARERVVCGLGAGQCLLRQECHHRVDSRIDPFDLRDVGCRNFDTAEVAAADARGQFLCVAKAEISRHLAARPRRGIHP
jgi:hypothetical protein